MLMAWQAQGCIPTLLIQYCQPTFPLSQGQLGGPAGPALPVCSNHLAANPKGDELLYALRYALPFPCPHTCCPAGCTQRSSRLARATAGSLRQRQATSWTCAGMPCVLTCSARLQSPGTPTRDLLGKATALVAVGEEVRLADRLGSSASVMMLLLITLQCMWARAASARHKCPHRVSVHAADSPV